MENVEEVYADYGGKHTIRIIGFNTTLPFTPSNEQAIYIEGEYDIKENHYIQKYYDVIQECFHHNMIDFCYIPFRTKEKSSEIALYHNPALKPCDIPNVAFTTKDFVEILFNGNPPADLRPSIIVYLRYESTRESAKFLFFELSKEEPYLRPETFWDKMFRQKEKDIKRSFKAIAASFYRALHNPKDTAFYSRVNLYDERDLGVLKRCKELFEEIDLRIHQLQERGVDSLILKEILFKMVNESRPLSRIVISPDLHIFLPDYNNLEIKMEPINKAVFLLFLRHEEGLCLKGLSDHRAELESFYTRLSHDDIEKRKESIDKLLDPTNNSINEKLSRIRQAFIAKFEEDLAENYFITGLRGEAKRIKLDRKLVLWE